MKTANRWLYKLGDHTYIHTHIHTYIHTHTPRILLSLILPSPPPFVHQLLLSLLPLYFLITFSSSSDKSRRRKKRLRRGEGGRGGGRRRRRSRSKSRRRRRRRHIWCNRQETERLLLTQSIPWQTPARDEIVASLIRVCLCGRSRGRDCAGQKGRKGGREGGREGQGGKEGRIISSYSHIPKTLSECCVKNKENRIQEKMIKRKYVASCEGERWLFFILV